LVGPERARSSGPPQPADSQVAPIANRFYKGVADLVLLTIDEQLVTSGVRYEAVPGWDEPFVHIYGPLNTDAVVSVTAFVPDAEGKFRFGAGS
jgi:uncharacterized protein (DUF952 family)